MLTGKIINEQYRVDSLIAKGGGGAVYEAFDIKNERKVALKHLIHSHSYLRSAFLREAKRLEALHHRSFPKVYEWFELKGDYFIAMEHIPGTDLRRELGKRGAPFTLEEVVSWTFILLDALNYLHNFDSDNPIIHRDIKPENLKLRETRNEIILLDLGLSKGAAAGNISELSVEESIVGYTRSYASPEQHFKDLREISEILIHAERLDFFTKHPTDARSDLYSLGAALFTLLTNTVPPSAVTRAEHLWNSGRDPLEPVHKINPQVPQGVSDIITRAMSFEPQARFASAVEMRNTLRDVLNDSTQNGQERQIQSSVKYGLLGECDSAVRSIAFSPADSLLASGSNDGMVRTWNITTGKMTVLGRCDFDKNGLSYISSVCFEPGGDSIVSASNDQAIRIWKTLPDADDRMRVLAVHRQIPRCIAFSPCGKYIVSGSSDGAVHLWEIASGESTPLGSCAGVVRSVAFAPDGASVFAGSDDGNLCSWQIESRSRTTLQTFAPDIGSLAVSPDGRLIAVGSADGHVRIIDTGASSINNLLVCDGSVRSLAFSPDGLMLAVGGEDCFARVCDLFTGAVRVLGQCSDVISAVAFYSDNRTVASASWDKTIRLWDCRSNN